MDTATFLWTLAATLLAGIQLFFQKVVAQEKRDSAFNGLMMYGISGVAAAVLLFMGHVVPVEWKLIALFGLFSGAIHSLGNFIRIEGLKYIDSVVYFPINKVLGPVLVVLGGVLIFSESITFKQYIGICFSLTVPLLLISSVEHMRQNNLRRGIWFVVLSTVCTSISILLTKEVIGLDADVLFILATAQIAGVLSSGALLVRKKRSLSHLDRRDVLLGAIAGILGFCSYYALLKALSTGLISIVYVIQAHYILIPIVLSVWWYKEHINMRKIIAVAVSFLAIGLLYK